MPDHVWHDGEGVAGVTANIGLDRLVFCAPSAGYTLSADYRPDGSSSSPEGLSFRPAVAPVANRTALSALQIGIKFLLSEQFHQIPSIFLLNGTQKGSV